jgi:hypothetical protein
LLVPHVRVRWPTILLPVAITVSVGAWAAWRLRPPSTPSTACARQPLPPKQVIFDLPAGTFMRDPAVSTSRAVTFIAGVPTGAAGLRPMGPTLLVLKDGDDVGRPTGDFAFEAPQIVVDRRGALHLLWGERVRSDDPPHAPKQKGLPVSIWHSVFGQGRWSRAERAYAASARDSGFGGFRTPRHFRLIRSNRSPTERELGG